MCPCNGMAQADANGRYCVEDRCEATADLGQCCDDISHMLSLASADWHPDWSELLLTILKTH
eukprot:4237992-Amphidinium_carterae.1